MSIQTETKIFCRQTCRQVPFERCELTVYTTTTTTVGGGVSRKTGYSIFPSRYRQLSIRILGTIPGGETISGEWGRAAHHPCVWRFATHTRFFVAVRCCSHSLRQLNTYYMSCYSSEAGRPVLKKKKKNHFASQKAGPT